jgi:hypothetical protein
MLRYTMRNGRLIRARTGTTITEQLLSQMLVYERHGILPRWFYIFSLYEQGGSDRAPYFLNRFETKAGLFGRLNRGGSSPLGDKAAFAAHCVHHEIPHVPVLAIASVNNCPAARRFAGSGLVHQTSQSAWWPWSGALAMGRPRPVSGT